MATPSPSGAEAGMMPPPPGVTPDFQRTTSVQIAFIVVFAVTYALATVALGLRVYTKAFLLKSVNWDEPMLIVAWAVTLAFFKLSLDAMHFGFGRNLWDVTPTQMMGYLQLLLSLALTYIWPPTLTKLSILFLYWRISADKIFRGCIIATAFVVLAYTIVFTVLFAGPCYPLLGTPESAVCLNNIAVSQAVLNILTDAVVIVLPMPIIHSLHMPLKQRISLGCILTLGSAACIASIVRVAYVRAMVDNPDVTSTQCSAAVWSLLEMNLAILCNSLAALKPFVRRHLPSMFSKTGSSGGNDKSGGSYAKHSKSGRGWGHSYQLHSVTGGKEEQAHKVKDGGIEVVDQFSVEFGDEPSKGTLKTTLTKGDTSSTDSILASAQHPARGHQAV